VKGPDDSPTPTPPASAQAPRGIEFANTTLPRFPRSVVTGLELYNGPWSETQAAHLLRRTMFGFRKQDLDQAVALGMNGTVALLLAPWTAPPPPVKYDSRYDPTIALGDTWVNADYDGNVEYYRTISFQAWWMGLVLGQDVSIREKMTLFWHNHFVSEIVDVRDAALMYRQLALLRENALGSVKDLVRRITLDCAMLRYLNGNTNTRTKPNENFARELQELFTIGKGPEIAPGNYTFYTEADVVTAAKVLTGWADNRAAFAPKFTASLHDSGNKTFSSAYGNRVITGRADETGARQELDDLLTMIFDQSETAKAICRKLYRWFVYYVIDEHVEQNIITPLAALLRQNNYAILPVLTTLLKSAHFFDPLSIGCVIKSPLDHVAGAARSFDLAMPADLMQRYLVWNAARDAANLMQQNLGGPPNVAGWPAYYQEPVFYEIWLNSDTIPKRFTFTDRFCTSTGWRVGSTTLKFDVVTFASKLSAPSDPNVVVAESARLLFPIEPTATQTASLKEFLAKQNQDYDWTNEWNAYAADPKNAANKKKVEDKLFALYKYVMTMAEFQLS
jgi:uncharacterized protein (DUF1800 family)